MSKKEQIIKELRELLRNNKQASNEYGAAVRVGVIGPLRFPKEKCRRFWAVSDGSDERTTIRMSIRDGSKDTHVCVFLRGCENPDDLNDVKPDVCCWLEGDLMLSSKTCIAVAALFLNRTHEDLLQFLCDTGDNFSDLNVHHREIVEGPLETNEEVPFIYGRKGLA